ncbi:hypothetical protein ACU686_42610 [Yinghuangia aomiensis]
MWCWTTAWSTRDVVGWLSRHGEAVVPALSAEAPYPLPDESTVGRSAGAVLDTGI